MSSRGAGASGRVRRALRALRGRLGLGPHVEWVYSETYVRRGPPDSHDPRRAEKILRFLHREGLLPENRLHPARPVSLRSLRRIHSDEYLESLQDPETIAAILGSAAIDPAGTLEQHRAIAGGTVLAARLAVERDCTAVNLGGGFHHARRDRGQGFCAFNDVAVAIAALRAGGFQRPVLIIDLDLHDGDGTREIFADDETVYTLSIHNRDLGTREARASASVALGANVEDTPYLDCVRRQVPPLVGRFAPGLVFYLAGADPAADDTLGDWRISSRAMLERDLAVHSAVRVHERRVPLVILLAGGYGFDAWRYTARFLGSLANRGRTLEPEDAEHDTLARYRRLARKMHPTDLTHEPAKEWTLTEQDLVGDLEPASATTRLLGYYTRHGIELALERLGFMDRLRERGFDGLQIDLDLSSRQGQTLRIRSTSLADEPLAELRVRRDASTIRGMELLRVEWLMLQNPAAVFSSSRPRLPGQKHPGLGMLRDVVSLMVLSCERLGLDGIVFWPSHYHLAVQSRRHLRFLQPGAEAQFRALQRALHGLSLTEATRAVDEGRVQDLTDGRAFAWTPSPMIIPVSERLERRMESDAYEREVTRRARDFEFRLAERRG